MTTATKVNLNKSMTVMQFLQLGLPEGTEVKVTTDNSLYGTSLIVNGGQLLKKRNNLPLTVTNELLFDTKVKVVSKEKEINLIEFIQFFKEGKKLKIVMPDYQREMIKTDMEEIPEFILKMASLTGSLPIDTDEAVTMSELAEGKFYIVE